MAVSAWPEFEIPQLPASVPRPSLSGHCACDSQRRSGKHLASDMEQDDDDEAASLVGLVDGAGLRNEVRSRRGKTFFAFFPLGRGSKAPSLFHCSTYVPRGTTSFVSGRGGNPISPAADSQISHRADFAGSLCKYPY